MIPRLTNGAMSAKYKLYSQVQSVGDGTMNGWWVVRIQADNGGGTGPGVITLSDVRPHAGEQQRREAARVSSPRDQQRASEDADEQERRRGMGI